MAGTAWYAVRRGLQAIGRTLLGTLVSLPDRPARSGAGNVARFDGMLLRR